MASASFVVAVVASVLVLPQEPAGEAVAMAKQQLAAGRQEFRAGRIDAAAELVAAALAVFERELPAQDLPTADAHLVLGAIAGLREDLTTAIGHYRRGLALRAAHEPAGSPYVQLLRFNLAASLQAVGDNEAALPLAEEGLAALPPAQAGKPAAGNLHAVAALALDGLGRYREAFDAYERALAILVPALGEVHRDVVRLRGHQGCMLCRLGRVDEGLAQLRTAVAAIRADQEAPLAVRRELDCALATMQLVHEGGAAVREAVREQLRLSIADSGRRLPGAASRLILLMAGLDFEDPASSDLALADAAIVRVLADYGPDHPCVASAMANVGRMHAHHGDRARGSELIDRAIAIFDRNPWFLGIDRWRVQWTRLTQHLAAGEAAAADAIALRILGELPRLLDAWTAPLDDVQRRELTANARMTVDAAILLAGELQRPAAAAWAPVLAWRALVARGFLQSLHWLHQHRDPASQALADELRAAMAVVAMLQRDGADAADIAAAGARRDALSDRLSAQLAARAPAVPTPAAIAAALAPDEVLIDFYAHVDIRVGTTGDFGVTERLLAFVVRPGAEPVRIDLGLLADVVPAVDTYLRAASRWTVASPTSAATIAAAGARLARLVWTPLQAHVPAGARVLVCPDSVLAMVPWACLPGERPGTFLVEQHEFVHVADPGELRTPAPRSDLPPDPVLVLAGDIHYGEGAFAALPRTAGEIESVAGAFAAAAPSAAVRKLRGDAATPAGIGAAVVGASFVHVATHGFCRGTRAAPDLLQMWIGNGLFDKPMRRPASDDATGLALAGARAPTPDDPGCLAADALARLDLSRCELAVLSACETGLGTVSAGEGLLGLRRSLRLAGARRSLTTVWRVDDAATARFMALFYDALWTRHEPPARALVSAQRAMLAALRAEGGEARTGLWGGFVLEGR